MMPVGSHRWIDPRHPRAKAICDRCGFSYDHIDLAWQMEWAGRKLINKRWLVCDDCLDEPNEQLRTINLPPDPKPIKNARPPNFTESRIDFLVDEAQVGILTDEAGNLLIKD